MVKQNESQTHRFLFINQIIIVDVMLLLQSSLPVEISLWSYPGLSINASKMEIQRD